LGIIALAFLGYTYHTQTVLAADLPVFSGSIFPHQDKCLPGGLTATFDPAQPKLNDTVKVTVEIKDVNGAAKFKDSAMRLSVLKCSSPTDTVCGESWLNGYLAGQPRVLQFRVSGPIANAGQHKLKITLVKTTTTITANTTSDSMNSLKIMPS